MKLRISKEELQKRSLFIATPIHDRPEPEFGVCLDEVRLLMQREGVECEVRQPCGESAITRARNWLADEFMRSGCSHLLFWDADIEASPTDVLTLLVLADPESEHDVICGAYPKKHICWQKVRDAAKQGWADDEPKMLEEFVGEFFFTPVNSDAPHNLDDPLEVKETGTGFMMIQRRVLTKFRKTYPDLSYYDDWNKWHEISAFFDNAIVDKRYLTEDYNFCRLVRQMGMKVWVVPRINLAHIGRFKYMGNISALAAAAEKNATAKAA